MLAQGCLKNISGIFLKLWKKEMLRSTLVIISRAGMRERIGGHLKRLFESIVNLNLRAASPFQNALGSKIFISLIDMNSFKGNMTIYFFTSFTDLRGKNALRPNPASKSGRNKEK